MRQRLVCALSGWFGLFLLGLSGAAELRCSGAGLTGSGLTSDGPIDLPVTIAKNQDGPDASSFVFTDTYGGGNLRKPRYAAPTVGDDEAVGTLSGNIKSPPGTVVLVIDGEIADTVETAADGAFTYDFTGALVGKTVSVAVQASDGSGALSVPVNVTPYFDDFAEEFKATVHLTDYSTSSEDADTAFAIQDATPAVSAQDQIAFLGRTAAETFLLGTIDVTGGVNTTLNETLSGLFAGLEFDPSENVYGADATTGVIYQITSAGAMSEIGDTSGVPAPRRFRIHPSGDYLAANAFTTNSLTGETTQTVEFIDLSDGTQTLLPLPAAENKTVTDVSFDWTTNTHLVVFKTFSDGTYNASEYEISAILNGTSTALPAATYSFDASELIADPVSDRGTYGNFVYRCASGGFVNLCGYNRTDGSLGVLAEGSFNVTGADFAPDGSYAAFAFEADDGAGGTDEEIALYDFSGQSVAFVGAGRKPRTVPSDCTLAAYLSPDANDNLQIGLFNLSSLAAACAAETLAISPATVSVSTGGTQAFTASGGALPYAFSIPAGSGSIEASIGDYTAPDTPDSVTVRVTDGAGQTADATATVLSDDASLSALALSRGTLTPTFASATTSYATALNYLYNSLTVTPTVSVSGATVTVNGSAVSSGSASSTITLSEGSNAVTATVTAPYGNTQAYTVTATREAATAFAQQAYVKGASTAVNAFSGWNIAIDGDTMVVGSYGAADAGSAAGAAYVYTRSGSTWTYRATLLASNAENTDYFGYAVAVDGNTIAVGAILEDSNATGVGGNQTDNSAASAGAVYVFTGSGAAWTQEAYIKASNAEAGDSFGYSVGLAGDTLVVGANAEASAATGIDGNQADNSAFNAGAAYVFTRSGTTWSQQAYLKASNAGASDSFGNDVAISGDTVVVAAVAESSAATGVDGNQADNTAANAGAAYVFTRSGATWSQQAYLKASNTDGGDAFGFSIAVSGDTILVGARTEASAATGINGNETDDSAPSAGAAYVFTRSGATWSQQAYLKASNAQGSDTFGHSVAIDGDVAVIGAPLEDSAATGINGNQGDSSTDFTGAAYAFVRSGTTWTQPLYLKASNAEGGVADGDEFGRAVAVSGDTLAVGAPNEDSVATGVDGNQADNSISKAGASYVFQ